MLLKIPYTRWVIGSYKFSGLLRLVYCLWLLVILGIGGCDQVVNTHAENQPLILQADAQLVYERSINLSDDSGPVLGDPRTFAIANESFYIVDDLHKAVFEYDLEGQYIRTIGHRGKGEGEYLSPMEIGVGLDEQIYVYDGGTAKLNAYSQAGRFVAQPFGNKKVMVGKFVVDMQGSVLQLISVQDQTNEQIVQLVKIAPGAESPEFSIDIAKGASSIMFIRYFGLCYSILSRHIYYMSPWDYEITEVEIDTGRQVRRFGLEPPGFRQLEFTSETDRLNMVEDITNVPLLRNMSLLGNDLLFVQFASNTSDQNSTGMMGDVSVIDRIEDMTRTFCMLYELTDLDQITVRKVKDPSNVLNYNVKIRSAGQSLYVYSPSYIPESGVNGRIDVYSFDFNRSL